ncbi:V-set and immunoglobulin domain-containing protein 4-like isoform X1 [Pithys albifrons albifrons]|uniref:V-set and immunoglobulin domain-containing protein 4-like isoform X1 n=1 Tax=Pithys albifrons albifrons TaxID=3385563 RepID=UPI003A5CFF08
MGMVLQAALLLGSLLLCSAFLDLSGPSEIKGVWKGSVTLPCAYVPMEDLVQQTLTWSVAHHQDSGTIFRRDSSGDHVLLSEYRDRVTWRASNNSMIAKEIVTKLEVVKVAATKPTIRAGQRGLTVPAGASTSLTCEASGSPPISYRWFRGSPGGKALLLSSSAELAWDSLRPSDSGTYFCEAANRAGAGAAQQSDAVELTVTGTGTGTDLPTTTVASWRDVGTPGRRHPTTEKTQTELVFRGTSGISWTPQASTTATDLPITSVTSQSGVGYPEKNYTTQDFQRTGLSLYLVILIAVVCGAVVFLVISLIICIRKPKDTQVYDVKLHNSRAATSSRQENTGHYEEPICFTENSYVMEPMENKSCEEVHKNVSDCVGNPQESEYEVGDTS